MWDYKTQSCPLVVIVDFIDAQRRTQCHRRHLVLFALAGRGIDGPIAGVVIGIVPVGRARGGVALGRDRRATVAIRDAVNLAVVAFAQAERFPITTQLVQAPAGFKGLDNVVVTCCEDHITDGVGGFAALFVIDVPALQRDGLIRGVVEFDPFFALD